MRLFKGKMTDSVSHPAHYNYGSIEVIDIIEDWELGFHLGNALKYILRSGKKEQSQMPEDLKKAVWYIERFLEMKADEALRAPAVKSSDFNASVDIKP